MGLPGNPEANLFRDAVTALERGDLANAERLFKFFLAIDENHFGALNLLTLALMRMGRYGEAETAIVRALRLNKRDENSWSNYAMILMSLGRFDEALEKLDRAVKLNPKNFRTLNNRGTLLKDLGRHERAISDFDRAIAADRRYFLAYYNKAASLAAIKRRQEALDAYDELLNLRPDFAAGWDGRGLALADLARFQEALASHDKAISLEPDFAEAHFNRGAALLALQSADEALASYDRAIALKPDHVAAHYNRGGALRDLNRFEDALASYDKAIALRPEYAEAYVNRGGALVELGRFGEALAQFDQAIALRGDYADAHYNKSLPLLLLGEYEAGWRAYEWRKRKNVPLGDRRFAAPLWMGEHDLAGKTILVHWEQGLGDTIQFCRYVKLLDEAGARVLFAPQKALRALMRSLGESIEIVDADDASLAFDFHCPLMSLPLAFGTAVHSIPAGGPYLSADPERVEQWASRLRGPEFKIGIVWLGSGAGTRVGRSAPLAQFRRLAETPGVRLISLQKAEAAGPPAELAEGMRVEFLGDDFDAGEDAFIDTAAVMKVLDLVITVDTAVAHLAGALGVPTWVALKVVPHWFWLLERSDSPWYPTMRLFRQKTAGDWQGVFAEIESALADFMAKTK